MVNVYTLQVQVNSVPGQALVVSSHVNDTASTWNIPIQTYCTILKISLYALHKVGEHVTPYTSCINSMWAEGTVLSLCVCLCVTTKLL